MTALTCSRTSSTVMRPLAPLPRTCASSTPSSRANFRTEGEACGFAPGAGPRSSGCGRAPISVANAVDFGASAAAGTGAGAAAVDDGDGAAGAAPVAPLRSAIGLPCETLSPILTFSSFTTPPADDGISIDALSLSTVISDCSGLTVSPGFTSNSITSTSLKSPMSGTFTSNVPPAAVAAAAAGAGAGAGAEV